MIQTKLKGMGVALITPFKEDESVDYDALIRLVDYQLQNNTDFLCAGHHGRNSDTDGRRKKENQENGHRTRKWSDTYPARCWWK